MTIEAGCKMVCFSETFAVRADFPQDTFGPQVTLPPPRRLVVGSIGGLSLALGGNLFGVTSFLLSIDGGKVASKLRLDTIVPVLGYKRCIDYQNGYEFLYPANWLADQRLYRRYAERIERETSLDPPSLAARRAKNRAPDPSAAFGPPGSNGEQNISVVVAPIREGFRLESLGTPEQAATRFLDGSIAPKGSGKTAILLKYGMRRDEKDSELYYFMEFIVEAPGKFKRHNIAVYAARNGLLYTLNAQAAAQDYTKSLETQYQVVADSFRILSSGAGVPSFPENL